MVKFFPLIFTYVKVNILVAFAGVIDCHPVSWKFKQQWVLLIHCITAAQAWGGLRGAQAGNPATCMHLACTPALVGATELLNIERANTSLGQDLGICTQALCTKSEDRPRLRVLRSL